MVAVNQKELTVVSGKDMQTVIHEATACIANEVTRGALRKDFGPAIEGKEEIPNRGLSKSLNGVTIGLYKTKLI